MSQERLSEQGRQAARASLDAFTRDSAALVDVGADVAVAARQAYLEAKRRHKADVPRTDFAAQDAEQTREVFRRSALAGNVRQGALADFAAGALPACTVAVVMWAVVHKFDVVVEPAAVAWAAAGLTVLATWAYLVASGRLRRFTSGGRFAALFDGVGGSLLSSSTGALFLSVPMLMAIGTLISKDSKERYGERLAQDYRTLDVAVAASLAAEKSGARPELARAFLQQETGISWHLDRSSAGGEWLALAQLRDGNASVQLLSPGEPGGPVIAKFSPRRGRSNAISEKYLYGVVAAPAVQTTEGATWKLKLSDSDSLEVLFTPRGALPPSPGSEVVVRRGESGEVVSVQRLDTRAAEHFIASFKNSEKPAE